MGSGGVMHPEELAKQKFHHVFYVFIFGQGPALDPTWGSLQHYPRLKQLSSLQHGVRSHITQIKWQKSEKICHYQQITCNISNKLFLQKVNKRSRATSNSDITNDHK